MERLDAALGGPSKLLPCGPLRVRRVGLVTGGGGSVVEEAATTGIDTVLTGEAAHHVFLAAEEREINVFLCGHYATETLGIRALAAHLGSKFGLDWEFISHPSGL
jgi:putative NIF3 family GTP cyclohydrolase 1 type 2